MERKAWLGVLVGLLALGGLATAGVEPSPFKGALGKLGAVLNGLDSVDRRLEAVLGHPPDPCHPEGTVGRLNAMANELGVLNGRVEAVTGALPAPAEVPLAVIEALLAVREAAAGVADQAGEGMGELPDSCRDALAAVEAAAQRIIGTVNAYLRGGLPN